MVAAHAQHGLAARLAHASIIRCSRMPTRIRMRHASALDATYAAGAYQHASGSQSDDDHVDDDTQGVRACFYICVRLACTTHCASTHRKDKALLAPSCKGCTRAPLYAGAILTYCSEESGPRQQLASYVARRAQLASRAVTTTPSPASRAAPLARQVKWRLGCVM